MTSLGLRLAAFSNLTFQKLREGYFDVDEDIAYHVFDLSLKYWEFGGDVSRTPLRLLAQHVRKLEAAQNRSNRAMSIELSNSSIQKQLWRLQFFSEDFDQVVEYYLKMCPSRTDAAFLCRIFSLGKEGFRTWEKARFKRSKPTTTPTISTSTISMPKLKSKTQKTPSPIKRKQAPTAVSPENLLPSPPAATAATQNNEKDNNDIFALHEHDPPAFTRDISSTITRSKTRFAVDSKNKPYTTASTTTAADEIAGSRIVDSTVLCGATPPGDDEFAAAAAMMSCHSGVENENKNADEGGFEKLGCLKEKQVQDRGLAEEVGRNQLQPSSCSII